MSILLSGLTRLEPTIYHTRDEHVSYYATIAIRVILSTNKGVKLNFSVILVMYLIKIFKVPNWNRANSNKWTVTIKALAWKRPHNSNNKGIGMKEATLENN
jgi:hypothetical protein